MFYILGKTEDPDCTSYDFPHHGDISLGYPNSEFYLVAKSPDQHLITSNHNSYGNGHKNSKKYFILFPWSLFLIRIINRYPNSTGTIITMNFAKESLIENLATDVYYSYMPNAFYGHKAGSYSSLPSGVSVLCGVKTNFESDLSIEDKISLTLNAVFDTDFRTAFDYEYHDNPMFQKYVLNEVKPKYYEDQGYPQKENHDEEYEEYENEDDEIYDSSLEPIALYDYLENVSLEDLIKNDWGTYTNPLSFYIDFFRIELNDQYFSDKKESINATN